MHDDETLLILSPVERELLLDLLHQVSTDSPLRAEAEGIIVRLENE